jgi:hypothetical protein
MVLTSVFLRKENWYARSKVHWYFINLHNAMKSQLLFFLLFVANVMNQKLKGFWFFCLVNILILVLLKYCMWLCACNALYFVHEWSIRWTIIPFPLLMYYYFYFQCRFIYTSLKSMKYGYSILGRVLVLLGYAPIAYLFYFLFFLQRLHVWYSCGTHVVHKSKKTQFFSLFFCSLFLFIWRFMFFFCFSYKSSNSTKAIIK